MKRAIRLLVVDDERVNRVVLEALLRKLCTSMQPHQPPPEFVSCEDGLAAVQEMRKAPCDGVFMDLMMPVMDGCEAIRTMHAEGMRPPVIVVTAMDPQAVRRLPLHAVQSIVFKPVSLDALRGPVETMLETIASGRT